MVLVSLLVLVPELKSALDVGVEEGGANRVDDFGIGIRCVRAAVLSTSVLTGACDMVSAMAGNRRFD